MKITVHGFTMPRSCQTVQLRDGSLRYVTACSRWLRGGAIAEGRIVYNWKRVDCRQCLSSAYRPALSSISLKVAAVALALLLFLPALTFAQSSQPLQLISDCITGVYDECQLVAGHWYHRKGAVWTRDDGKAEAPPVMPVAACPAQQAVKEPSRYDWSFIKGWKLYVGVGTSFAVTGYDISTSHGQEATRFYRNDQGQLNKSKYWLVTGGVNAALLPLDLQPNHKWRWVSFGGRVGLALWRFKAAAHNQAVKQ